MKIGEVAEATGIPAKTIRYYERAGLLEPAPRCGNGYRDYSDKQLHNLHFLKRARGLGFSVQECRELLALYSDKSRSSSDVKRLALERVAKIESKIAELKQIHNALSELARLCHGDQRPDCPIIDELSLEDSHD